jgi:hypothetical protein
MAARFRRMGQRDASLEISSEFIRAARMSFVRVERIARREDRLAS